MTRWIVTAALSAFIASCVGCGNTDAVARHGQDGSVLLEARKSFTYQGKPIPPFFLADFHGGDEAPDFWLRETGDRIAAVAVEGLFFTRDGSYADASVTMGDFVRFSLPGDDGRDRLNFGYRFLGTSPSGVTVLEYYGNTGGSGTPIGIVLVRFEIETVGATRAEKRERLVMRFIGEYCWGDRVYRDAELDGNVLKLGPMHTHIPAYQVGLEPAREVVLE
ncbi:MAG: hypothetical protein JXL80_13635 [Planctomycetes bacterium]|nr:hypothetical protein [Planctomycetota bacterium]